jgi:hypothetical protein
LNQEGFSVDTTIRSLAQPVAYEPGFEVREEDEMVTGSRLVESLRSISETTFRDAGHATRSVHAKSHGLLRAELRVLDGLPPALAQGIFAKAGQWPVVMRLSTIPGDILDDSVSTPRGLAIKVIGVEGARLEDLRSVLDPKGKCFGSFRFTDAKTGVADMHCNDGSAARLSFSALSSFSGYGSGSTPNGPASFTFGLRPEVAALHLILPPGKKLVEGSDGLRLEAAKS